MTLTVDVYARTSDGESITLDVDGKDYPRNDLFGIEVCRKTLWGADVMEELGLEILPSLSYRNIECENEELELLEHEAKIILDNLETISHRTKFLADYIEFRVLNLIHAIAKARSLASEYSFVGVRIV
jgi:hypothetical protein